MKLRVVIMATDIKKIDGGWGPIEPLWEQGLVLPFVAFAHITRMH
jgi:hypothetical protein